jgi:hypothetical protein
MQGIKEGVNNYRAVIAECKLNIDDLRKSIRSEKDKVMKSNYKKQLRWNKRQIRESRYIITLLIMIQKKINKVKLP